MISATTHTIVVVDCIQCGKTQHITAANADLASWQNGEKIQNTMTYLSDDEREILISQVCGPCFDNMFGPQAGQGEDDE